MIFSSITFIFVFLPLVLLLFYTLRKELRFPILLLSSLFFYFYGEAYLIWIMLLTTFIDYGCALLISGGIRSGGYEPLEQGGQRNKTQKFWLSVSIVSNLLLLGYFKYFNFFTENLIQVFELAHLSHFKLDGLAKVGLPLGISFYTFQSMSYTIDVYRGHVTANRSLMRFATFVTMFPQLVAGPIVRYADLEEQFKHHSIKTDQFVEGIKRFLAGLAKKVLIANTLGQIADQIFAIEPHNISTGIAWIGLFAYSLQIYFDFSGYSCMAIGLGKMFGFEFPENFNYPYIAGSVQEFWRRWHISLSTWFRDYVYIPLGGSKTSVVKTYRNLFIVFLLCGLWHGASWNFVIWGLFHGLFLSLEKVGLRKILSKVPKAIRHIYTLLVVMLAWVFFRTETLAEAFRYIKVLFVYKTSPFFMVEEFLPVEVILSFIFGILFSMPVLPRLIRIGDGLKPGLSAVAALGQAIVLFLLFLWCVINLTSGTYNPFIYFRF
jgi:alginate O-acetyltransferase complex protein AlgI